MHNIPIKEIIVNDDAQVRLLGSTDGSTWAAYIGSTNLVPSNADHRFQLEGFLDSRGPTQLQLLSSATRVIENGSSAGVAEIASYIVTAGTTGIIADDVLRLVSDALDLTPTEFQNQPVEKRYQVASTQTTAPNIVAQIVAAINSDPYAPVTAYAGFNNASPASDDSAKIVLVAKKVGYTIGLFKGAAVGTFTLARVANGVDVYHTVEDTFVETVAAALPINTYEYLKNINWAKNFEIDRNIAWMPLPGTTYSSYYFEVNGTVPDAVGNNPIPNAGHNLVKTGYKIWVKDGLTLDTALNAFLTDMNV